jgi:hypothetical protein
MKTEGYVDEVGDEKKRIEATSRSGGSNG